MSLYTNAQYEQLLKNGSPRHRHEDHVPVVKWSCPDTGETWLVSRIDPDHDYLAFGLYDFGGGLIDAQYIWLPVLWDTLEHDELSIRRDRRFKGVHPLSVYVQAAQTAGYITCSAKALTKAALEVPICGVGRSR